MIFDFVFAIVLLFAASNDVVDSATSRQVHKDLSDIPHHADSQNHDVRYDHEAVLGKENAKVFDSLSPEESKARLRKLMESRVDGNRDGYVTKEELAKWIKYTSQAGSRQERDTIWKTINPDNAPLVDFDQYAVKYIGRKEDYDDKHTKDEIEKRRIREQRRWTAADENGDGKLDIEEFFAFTRPEEVSRMGKIVAREHTDDMDKNLDGRVSEEEYFADLRNRMSPEERKAVDEPEWLKAERKSFSGDRDKNRDGFLDIGELQEWIMPSDYDHVETETSHIFEHVDKDKDSRLSLREIMDKSDIFAGSQATNYGDILKKPEL